MSRKIGTSVVLTLEQMQWLEEQDGSISEHVRNAVEEYKDTVNTE